MASPWRGGENALNLGNVVLKSVFWLDHLRETRKSVFLGDTNGILGFGDLFFPGHDEVEHSRLRWHQSFSKESCWFFSAFIYLVDLLIVILTFVQVVLSLVLVGDLCLSGLASHSLGNGLLNALLPFLRRKVLVFGWFIREPVQFRVSYLVL